MNFLLSLTLVAAQTSILDQLKGVPKQTWINIGICLITVIVIVKVWRGLKKVNEFMPYIVAVMAGFLIFFYWIYDRSEPRFLTPVIDKVAPFFPSKSTLPSTNPGGGRGR